MKKGIINIIGQIGSYKDATGKVKKGIELVDVIKQVTDAGEVDEYIALINGNGGRVTVGNQISDYLRSLKNLSTVIYKQSASIDTKISMAAKKGKRYIIKGASFFVHNPYTRIEGDAGELLATAEELKEAEDEMVNFYVENSNLNKKGIIPLMKEQTSFTDEQAVSFGFVDKIITEDEAKAMGLELIDIEETEIVALLETKKTNDMSEFKKETTGFLAEMRGFMAKIGIKLDAKASLEVKTNDGKTLSVETEEKEIKIGDIVSCEGKLVSEKVYILADGKSVKVNEKSEIMEILPSEQEKNKDYAELETKYNALVAEFEAMKKEKSESEKEFVAIRKNFDAIAKQITSTYEPEQPESTFRKVKTEDVSDVVLAAQARSKRVKEEKRKQFSN